MSRATIARLAGVVADLRAQKMAERAVPLATEELRAAGFRAYPWENGTGLAVDEAPGLTAKLDDLSARGIHPAHVFILRKLDGEPDGERVSDPTTNGSTHG